MSTILVTITVDDFDHFRSVFETRGLELRRRHGSGGVRVMRHADDPERVCLLFDWDADAFRGFLADPDVRASMQAGGTLGPPAITYLEDPLELPA
jgi:quinol monooxygenase YgiN